MEFHAHIYFDERTEAQAERLRAEIAARLPAIQVYPLVRRPVGPHPQPMFELGFESVQLGDVVSLLKLRREGLSVLVHPVTGDDQRDHSEYAVWLGEVVELEMGRLDPSPVLERNRRSEARG